MFELGRGMILNDTYQIVDRIGTGGGGIVYRAVHLRMGKYVAVKQIRDQMKGVLVDRAEVDILKELKNDYLPQVYDFLEINGESFTVMEFVEGRSLDQVLETRRFSQKEVLFFTKQLAEALNLLHKQKSPIIHSDIKPGNVMLMPNGNICLIDFNVSLALTKGNGGTIAVSEGYSPPEQYGDYPTYRMCVEQMHQERQRKAQMPQDGHPPDPGEIPPTRPLSVGPTAMLKQPQQNARKATAQPSGRSSAKSSAVESTVARVAGQGYIDARSDIYALGATIYHMLTGVRPSLDFEEVVPIRSMDADISEGFALIIEKMMALDPKDRYANGGELLDALNHIYDLDSDYKSYRRGRRIKKAVILLMFLAGIGAAGAGLVTMYQENQAVYYNMIEEAEELIGTGDYEEAAGVIEEALVRDPEQIEAYEKEVLRLYTMGAYDELISYVREITANGSYVIENENDEILLADIFYLVGNACIELEDYTNAVYYFTLALAYNTENSYYYRDYAIALAKNGNTEAAQETLEQAVSLGLAQDSIAMTQGEVAYAQGDYEAAAEYLTNVIQTTEDSDLLRRAAILCAQAYQNLGGEYIEKAVTLLESVQNQLSSQVSMQITQMLGEVYVSMAQSAATDGETEEWYRKALDIFLELYDKGYTTRQMMENIAIIYESLDLFDEAAEMLTGMAESYPDDYRTYKRLALLEADIQQELDVGSRDYSDFAAYYEKAVELYEAAGGSGDEEMQMLEVLMQDLADAGWF